VALVTDPTAYITDVLLVWTSPQGDSSFEMGDWGNDQAGLTPRSTRLVGLLGVANALVERRGRIVRRPRRSVVVVKRRALAGRRLTTLA
jgi:hypothetical protein